MIFDKILHWKKYLGLSAAADTAFRAASEMSENTAEGRYEFGDGVFCNVSVYSPKPVAEAVFETHERYIDLQLILSGEETFLLADPAGLCVSNPYSSERDIAQYTGEGQLLTAKAGQFYFVYPWDAHAPGLFIGQGSAVKKAVFKIPYGG